MRERAKGWFIFSTRQSLQDDCGAAGSPSTDREPRGAPPPSQARAQSAAARRGVRGERLMLALPRRPARPLWPRGNEPKPSSSLRSPGPDGPLGRKARQPPDRAATAPLRPDPAPPPAGARGVQRHRQPRRPSTHRHPPLPAAGHDPPLASLPEPCRGSGAGDEFRRAAGGAERSTSRTHPAELRRWAGPGRDPGALVTPTRGGGASGHARGHRRSPPTWVSAAHRASAGGGTRPPSPPG
ncbi:PREDICTED: proline-rich protein 2-like [Hipposideros armiger]|uniref:Proline-rich protein 2-like n=1 Tax=Hipposideros armiger TaxID=186990 RepID=A0A8B7RTW5_HIPAR|nr:PREDICTED: proline-rich protein 2-like [Hipposideros armiger]